MLTEAKQFPGGEGLLRRVWGRREGGRGLAALGSAQGLLVAFVGLALLYLVGSPLLMLVLASVKASQNSLPFDATPFTLANYTGVFGSLRTYQLLGNTAIFAGGSLALGGALGILFAWLIERTDVPFGSALAGVLVVPMGIPPILTAISYVFILDPRIGLLNIATRGIFGLDGLGPFNVYAIPGMFFVQGMVMAPTLYLMLSASFRRMDPALEEAAHMSGASSWQTVRRVTLPVLSPALLAAFIFYAVVALEAFEIPGAIGLRAGLTVFSTEIYNATNPASLGVPDYGRASALSMVIMAIAIILIALYYRAVRRAERFTTVTGRGFRPRRVRLGLWRGPALLVVAAYVLLAVVLVPLILLWVSLQPFYAVPSPAAFARVSLRAYQDIVSTQDLGHVLLNTLGVGLLASTITVAVTFGVAWISIRSRVRGRRLFDVAAFLPQAVPGVVIGLAMLVLHLSFHIPIYGTVLIIALGVTTKYLAFGSRTLSAAYLQIHHELEEAAALSGGNLWTTFQRVSLALLKPAALNTWVWVFLHSIRELPVAVMLYTSGSVVLSTLVWGLWQQGKTALVGVLGVLMFAISMAVSVAARYYSARQPSGVPE